MSLHCTCPECKNEIDLAAYPSLAATNVIECNVCGITLEVMKMNEDGSVETEIVDEGK